MRKQMISVLLALGAMGGLAACTPGTETGQPPATTGSPGSTPATTAPGTTAPGTTAPGTTAPGTTPPDAETTVPAPAPPTSPLPSGPGTGDVELSITVKASKDGPATNYTLVCKGGAPVAESQHPDAAAACAAVKENPAVLNQPAPRKNVSCTQQYGGPQVATVTGAVDGKPVEATFSLRNGCEIGAWNAAKDILGSANGAV